MKKHLFLMMLAAAALTFAGCDKDDTADDAADDSIIENGTTPPHAASTHTWTFGEQIWSDAIHIPACNKTNFPTSNTEPQCRSYTSGTSTWYYYNWPYVTQNATTLCPSPWRVPTRQDFYSLGTIFSEWGYGGLARVNLDFVNTHAYYWSSTANCASCTNAYYLRYGNQWIVTNDPKRYGMQVRCVK